MPLSTYLQNKTPVYTASVLAVVPTGETVLMDGTGYRIQEIDEYHGGFDHRYDWGGAPVFLIGVPFDFITDANLELIKDFYLNPLKANGIGRTFPWQHPTELNLYTASFNNPMGIWSDPAKNQGINGVVFRIGGNYSV